MKNGKQRATLLSLLLGIGLATPFCSLVAAPSTPMGASPTDPKLQLSDEDVKFLEELGKQIQKEVEQLPTREQLRAQGIPEDQVIKAQTKEKFNEDVEKYSKMSEEDLLAELEKTLAEVEKTGTPEARPEYPPANVYQGEQEAEPYVAPTPAPVAKPAIPSNKQQAALELIEKLLSHITNFLSKAQIMVELPGKITAWIKEGKLKNWPATLTWNSFKSQVEELQAKLNKIKDKDPKSSTYKYLDELIKDEPTYNNLIKIKDSLARSEPKIELGSFGIDKMTTAGRQAIRDTLLSLHDAITSVGISASLDRIIEKYDPTAKKIKETEEAAQRRAVEESRRGRTPGYATVGGYPKTEEYGKTRYDFDRGYNPYSPGTFEAPKSEKPTEDKKDAKGASAGGGAGGAKKGEDKKDEKSADKPKREEDKTATDLVKDFNGGLFQFVDAVESNENLAKLEAHMKDASFVDEEMH